MKSATSKGAKIHKNEKIHLVIASSKNIYLDSCDAKIEVLIKKSESLNLKIYAKGGVLKLRSKCEEGGELKLEGAFHADDDRQEIDVELLNY